MQLLGGIGQRPLEPVTRRLGLLRAGAITRRGRTQEIGGEWRAGAEPGRVQRRGQHRPRVRIPGLGVLPACYQWGAAARIWVSPYPGAPSAAASRRSRPAAARARSCSAGLNSGPMRITTARSSTSRSRARGSGTAARHGGVGGVPVRPQRGDKHYRAGRPAGPAPILRSAHARHPGSPAAHPATPPSAETALGQRGDLVGPAGCTSHHSGSSALTASAAHRVLPTEDPPTSSTNPPRSAAAATLARTPDWATSTSRGTYSGKTSSGVPGTLIAACTPSSRGSTSPPARPPPGPGRSHQVTGW